MIIKLVSKTINDKYTEYVYDTFDIQNREETSTEIPFKPDGLFNSKWNIGVIFGGSGSGKTSILKWLGTIEPYKFDNNKSLISNFDWLEPKDAAYILTSMGLSSVPTWLRPFNLLSNGEQYRAFLAYQVAKNADDEIIIIDEYTSVVDRDVAKTMSYALQKYIRRENKKIILASCHYDIMEWITPDWICSPQKGGTLERGEWLRQSRPKINLQISRVKHETWDLFKSHHYLSQSLNGSCKLLLFEWNNKPVAVVATLNQPGPGDRRYAVSISRVVVLPEYQGMGLGSLISEFCGSILLTKYSKVYLKTVNPALGIHMSRSQLWKATAKNGVKRNGKFDPTANRLHRPAYSYEYVGSPISGYEDLLLAKDDYKTKPFELF